jgi:murein DD-endopeptidase MepM/ murein hydrolase activator NlpD
MTIKGSLSDGTPFGFSQLVRVRDGGYVYDLPLSVPEETINPAVTKPEDSQWAALSAPVTMKRFWDGIFLMPTPLNKEYCLETNQCWSSRFGSRRSYNGSPYKYFHTGLDIVGGTGTDIYAPAAGRVVFAGPLTVRGNATMIDHGWGVFSAYMHQSDILVKVGDFVEAGQLIGRVGSTGRVEDLISTGKLSWVEYK